EWARTKELSPLFEELMLRHYDPHYERSQSNHFKQWPQRQVLETDDLSDAGIAKLAQQVRALQTR
ncbi:MAG: tRNA 2-selenouridine(34) synthase MnmH, partial [Comamonas sp.]